MMAASFFPLGLVARFLNSVFPSDTEAKPRRMKKRDRSSGYIEVARWVKWWVKGNEKSRGREN